ncbi:MAG: DUF4399 domain-containing protein [Candidatus Nitrohelix vancouverensis]|uniref:DUF4399 domain-containing protein n=1 Tax=Candidatus Nitrohelix vancouverensis TaxID=2705534 RepID=A0A7T0C4L2_9BACT|nr:MAG: DUF4399 domain-containing protein [Candidatus Nitrohelix vancouverensis]
MKRQVVLSVATVLLFLAASLVSASAENSVTIVSPKNGDTVESPVEFCMETEGVEVEPAKNGVNDGKGHHHLLIDTDVPSDLSKPIGKDAQHVHMGSGDDCKSLKLSAGEHTVTTLFAKGNHVPYDPEISDTIQITVK